MGDLLGGEAGSAAEGPLGSFNLYYRSSFYMTYAATSVGGVTSAPLLNRFRPAGAAGMLGTTCGTTGLNQQRRPPSIPNRKEDYGPSSDDPATSFLELYHRLIFFKLKFMTRLDSMTNYTRQ